MKLEDGSLTIERSIGSESKLKSDSFEPISKSTAHQNDASTRFADGMNN